MQISKIRRISLCLGFFTVLPVFSVTLKGRLPGEYFREDNPPRFGALMSFASTSDSVVVMHVNPGKPEFTIARQLAVIARGFKIKPAALEKLGIIEGSARWLQYSFRKKAGGGFIYITRHGNSIIYLVIFNLQYDALSIDLPYIDRYIKQMQIKENE